MSRTYERKYVRKYAIKQKPNPAVTPGSIFGSVVSASSWQNAARAGGVYYVWASFRRTLLWASAMPRLLFITGKKAVWRNWNYRSVLLREVKPAFLSTLWSRWFAKATFTSSDAAIFSNGTKVHVAVIIHILYQEFSLCRLWGQQGRKNYRYPHDWPPSVLPCICHCMFKNSRHNFTNAFFVVNPNN